MFYNGEHVKYNIITIILKRPKSYTFSESDRA